MLGDDTMPEYSADLPGGGPARKSRTGRLGSGAAEPIAVYLPACVNSMFGAAGDGVGATEAFTRLLERAGVRVIVPEGIEAMCCSTPWTSKGYTGGRDVMAARVVKAVREASRDGALPIVSDAASCTEGFAHIFEDSGLEWRTEDAVAFVAREVLPALGPIVPLVGSLVLHPTCSTTHLGIGHALQTVGEAVADEVLVPARGDAAATRATAGCCTPSSPRRHRRAGRGDRGRPTRAHASCNRTCEIGMTRATGERVPARPRVARRGDPARE